MTTRFSRRAIAYALLASTALCASPAFAQLAPPAPVRQTVDQNGVNLFDGALYVDGPALSMGQGEPQGLSFNKLSRGGGWTDNVIAALNLSGTIMTVSLGGFSDTFTVSGSTYTSTEAKGATLTYNSTTHIYTYTRADGTVVHFDKNLSTDTPYFSNQGRVTDITYPSGAKLVVTYESQDYCFRFKVGGGGYICEQTGHLYRPSTVRNSYGYQLTFTYGYDYMYDPEQPQDQPDFYAWSQSVGVSETNLAVASGASTPSQSWATVTVGADTFFQVTDPMARLTKFRMNGNSVLGITLPGSGSEDMAIAYSGGRVSTITTPAGTTNYSSSDAGGVRTVTVSDPLTHVTTYAFDIASQRLTSVTDTNSHTTSAQYDSNGRLTRVTKPEGNYTQVTYDARGNVTENRNVAKAGSGLADIVATAGFDTTCTNPKTCNEPNWTKDARNNQTDYTYDSTHGGVLTVTRPAPSVGAIRPQTRYSYTSLQAYFKNSMGNIVASGEPVTKLTGVSACQTLASCTGAADETKTAITYGPQTTGIGNNLLPVSISRGDGTGTLTATTAYTYDDVGNLTYVDGPLSGTADTTRTLYDADREQLGTIGPDPDGAGSLKNRAVRNTIDTKGLTTKVEYGTTTGQTDSDWTAFAPAQAIDMTYDTRRRVATRKLGAGGTDYALTQTDYYADDRVQCVAQRMNTAVYGSLPASACTLGTAGSFGNDRIAKSFYDPAGNPTQLQVAFATTDVASERTLTYSNDDMLATLKDAENNLTTYEYDGFDRLSKTRYPVATKGGNASSTTDYELLGYDVNSNVTSFQNRAAQSIGLTYDNLNRKTLKDLPGTEPDVTFAYDNLDRITSVSQAGNALSFAWDALSRNLTQLGPQGTATSDWDLAGRRTQLTYPGTGLYVNYDYLLTGEVTKVRENGATSGVGLLATYGYDDLGNRTSLTFGNGVVQAFTFDPVSRLASLTNNLSGTTNDLTVNPIAYSPTSQIASTVRTGDAYAWTGHGNGSTAFTQNGLNQQITVGGVAATWDTKGNLASEPQSGKTYGYSSENLLTSASGGVTLGYDPALRLYQVVGAATTRFAYDGVNAIAEYNGSNALQRRYVFGPGADEALVQYEGTGTTDRRFMSTDERGSIISLTDSVGALLNVNRYDEYGKPQSANTGRFQYTGQMWLSELGAYYYKARVYLPHLGIFAQTDPVGSVDSPNLYAYVLDDPVNLGDPTGQTVPDIVITGTLPSGPSGMSMAVTGGITFVSVNTGLLQQMIDAIQCAAGEMSSCTVVVTGKRPKPKPKTEPASQCRRSLGSFTAMDYLNAYLLGGDDALTFGGWSKVNDWLFGPGTASKLQANPMYPSGELTVALVSAGRLGYAGIARSFSFLGGAEAVAARNSLKGWMSGLGTAHPRLMTYEEALAKYGSDKAVAQAAARTNSKLNTLGAYGTSSSFASDLQRC